ncbi:YajG family lipoprotein [Psychromonas antarctica]|jgi:uncharacterized lipoprotein|uniref:YajG family lipoprotein n=1 Tax=Psychromonas antarctica TaxID=67573 RepID=UPI001EE7DBB2|nr:YajG family lipoprotein [Psychromonas antarctica]MCG6199945.1 YajG family lipoprotein [Psychromonas antarctica]
MLHLILKNAHKTMLVMSAILLVACSTPPTSVQLQPEISFKQTGEIQQSALMWKISSQDQRIAHYLIEVTRGDNAASLINESQSSRLTIENLLHEQWAEQGIALQATSKNTINIQLIKLLAKVEQNSLTYKTDANIVIEVKLTAENKIFNKTFKSHYGQEGVFRVSEQTVTKQLNDQLSQLLNEIVQDSELNAKLHQF